MPIQLIAPGEAGVVKYHIQPVQREGAPSLPQQGVCCEIVSLPEGSAPLEVDWKESGVLRSYDDDHIHARALLAEWVQKNNGNETPRVLEIGGNSCPMIGCVRGDKYSVDIDAIGVAFGDIWQRFSRPEDIKYVVADGFDLPFPEKSLDCIATFASFHHFPNPVKLLRHLRRKLADDGILALMCEPIGHVFRDTVPDVFRQELINGVNEQSFMFWEYREMLRASGFAVQDALIDVGSIKLLARPIKEITTTEP